MFDFDTQLFYLINRVAGRYEIVDFVFAFFATSLIYVLLGAFLIIVFIGFKSGQRNILNSIGYITRGFLNKYIVDINRHLLFTGILSSVIAYITSQLISYIYFRPRPFVVLENITQLISKSYFDKSFPSDHTILAFSIAFSVLYFDRKTGWWFIAGAFLVGLSRIYTGVHYPLDVIGGILLSFLVSYGVYKYFPKIYKNL